MRDAADMRANILRWTDGPFRMRLLGLLVEQRISTWAGMARQLRCDPRTAKSHTHSLCGLGLLELRYHEAEREWAYRATDYGREVAAALTGNEARDGS